MPTSRRSARLRTGSWLFCALLASSIAHADLPGEPSRPFRAPIAFLDGGREIVRISALTESGLLCTDGAEEKTVEWNDIRAKSAFDAMRRAADRDNAEDWLWIGVKMLERDESGLAERAFKAAARANTSAQQRADRALALHASDGDPRAVLGGNSDKNGTGVAPAPSTNGRDDAREGDDRRPDHLWPVLSDEAQSRAIVESREWASKKLRTAGVTLRSHESDHYILHTSGGVNFADRLLRALENMHGELKDTFLIPEDTIMYHGKCAVFILDSQQAFVDFEDRVYNNDAEGFGGFFHPTSTFCAVVSYVMPNPSEMESLLVHETTHAFMHRYKSRYRLPTWANEGLADFMAGHLVPASNKGQRNWSKAREFVLNGGDPADIMAQSYANGQWPDDYSYPVSHMIVRFMITHKAPEFRQWIEDIKDGRHWIDSMAERFSPSPDRTISPDVLARGFARQMRSERSYSN